MSDAKSLTLFSRCDLAHAFSSLDSSLAFDEKCRSQLDSWERKTKTRNPPGRQNPEFNRWGDDGVWKAIPVVPIVAPARVHRSRDNSKLKKGDGPQRTCVAEICSDRQKMGRYLRKPGTLDQYLCFTCWAKST